MDVVSKIELHPVGMAINIRIILNFPKPVAVIAVSKLAGVISEKDIPN